MADSDRKIDEMFGMLHELKPVVMDIREGQKEMDARVRGVEVQAGAHSVKIERIQSDLDGLGKKIRYAPTPAAPEGRSFGAFLEIIASLPTYWHVVVSAVLFASSVAAVAWGRK